MTEVVMFSAESSTDDESTVVITLKGELDIETSDVLRGEVENAISRGPARLIFELGGLTFTDSSGIAVMLQAATSIPEVIARDPVPIVRTVIEVTGLSETVVRCVGQGSQSCVTMRPALRRS